MVSPEPVEGSNHEGAWLNPSWWRDSNLASSVRVFERLGGSVFRPVRCGPLVTPELH
jgi:hypothetical protein